MEKYFWFAKMIWDLVFYAFASYDISVMEKISISEICSQVQVIVSIFQPSQVKSSQVEFICKF